MLPENGLLIQSSIFKCLRRPDVRLGHGVIGPKLLELQQPCTHVAGNTWLFYGFLAPRFVYIADGLKHMTSASIKADGWQP
jgi:hypothetical protein